MDTEYIRDNISRDKAFADMQMSIVSELKEIQADILTQDINAGMLKLTRLINELVDDARITYSRFEVLEGGKRWDYQNKQEKI